MICCPGLATSHHSHWAPSVHVLRWSQVVLVSWPDSQSEHFPYPPLQAQRVGGGAEDLDSKIFQVFFSSSVETPHSNVSPGKKDVAFYFRGKKSASILPQTWGIASVDFQLFIIIAELIIHFFEGP